LLRLWRVFLRRHHEPGDVPPNFGLFTYTAEPHDLDRLSESGSNSVAVLRHFSEIAAAETSASCKPSSNADELPLARGGLLKKPWFVPQSLRRHLAAFKIELERVVVEVLQPIWEAPQTVYEDDLSFRIR
jgi:hypothetical protein